MADTKISALPAATTPLAGTEVLPIVQGGATVKVSINNLTAGKAVSMSDLTTTNIQVTNLKAKDGTAAGSIADSTGVVTLTSSVLTATDINGGTIDGVTIGGASAGAVSSTNLAYTGTFTGGTGVVNLGSGQLIKDASGNLMLGQPSLGLQNSQSFSWQGTGDAAFSVNHSTANVGGDGFIRFGYNGGQIGSITQNGTTGVLYNLTSDYRLKNDPQPLTGSVDFIMALQPKKWQWWDGSGEGVGFIAHEFMEIAKYSGNGVKDAVDKDGKPVYQSIQPSSSEVMAHLTAFVQEQQALIQNLTTRLIALEGN